MNNYWNIAEVYMVFSKVVHTYDCNTIQQLSANLYRHKDGSDLKWYEYYHLSVANCNTRVLLRNYKHATHSVVEIQHPSSGSNSTLFYHTKVYTTLKWLSNETNSNTIHTRCRFYSLCFHFVAGNIMLAKYSEAQRGFFSYILPTSNCHIWDEVGVTTSALCKPYIRKFNNHLFIYCETLDLQDITCHWRSRKTSPTQWNVSYHSVGDCFRIEGWAHSEIRIPRYVWQGCLSISLLCIMYDYRCYQKKIAPFVQEY